MFLPRGTLSVGLRQELSRQLGDSLMDSTRDPVVSVDHEVSGLSTEDLGRQGYHEHRLRKFLRRDRTVSIDSCLPGARGKGLVDTRNSAIPAENGSDPSPGVEDRMKGRLR
jgi:hypothetical protein